MNLLRLVVEGFRSVDALTWAPGDLTVLTGPRADDVCAAAAHVANTARGWGAFGAGFAAEPPHPAARFTDGFAETRCFAHLAPPPGASLRFGYELVVERVAQGDGWAIVYERVTLDDDFELKEVLERRGSRAVFTPSPRRAARAGERPPREEVITLADVAPALAGVRGLASDPNVEPYAERLAGWCFHPPIDPSPAGAPRRFAAGRAIHDRLTQDGRNLVNALCSLWEFEPLRAPVLAGLRALDPTVRDVTFPRVGEEGMTAALAHDDGRSTPLDAMPDEVVAWLLRGAMLAGVWPAPLLVIDAVEAGLPPAARAPLAALLRAAAARTQVVLKGASAELDAALEEAFAGDGPRLVRSAV